MKVMIWMGIGCGSWCGRIESEILCAGELHASGHREANAMSSGAIDIYDAC